MHIVYMEIESKVRSPRRTIQTPGTFTGTEAGILKHLCVLYLHTLFLH